MKNKIILLIIILTISCKSKQIHFYLNEHNPTSVLMVSDSSVFIGFDGQFYNTGRLYSTRKSSVYLVLFDSTPFNDKRDIDVHYSFNQSLDLNKLNIEYKNVSLGFICILNGREFYVKNDTNILVDRRDFINNMLLNFKFTRSISNPYFKYYSEYQDSNSLVVKLDPLLSRNFNKASINCSNFYLYHYFKNGEEFFPDSKLTFQTRRNKISLSSHNTTISYSKDAYAPNLRNSSVVKNFKENQCKNSKCYFIKREIR